MALSISRRVLRAFGVSDFSFGLVSRCNACNGHVYGDSLTPLQFPVLGKKALVAEGRARHGTLRGPKFRGGATMHGPKPRSHPIKLNEKVRRLGLKIAISARAAGGKLMVFEDLEVPSHKTKNIVNFCPSNRECQETSAC